MFLPTKFSGFHLEGGRIIERQVNPVEGRDRFDQMSIPIEQEVSIWGKLLKISM